jgi:hypothetical protein
VTSGADDGVAASSRSGRKPAQDFCEAEQEAGHDCAAEESTDHYGEEAEVSRRAGHVLRAEEDVLRVARVGRRGHPVRGVADEEPCRDRRGAAPRHDGGGAERP